ncbi:MAG: hypothetical protein FJX44_05030 [Alphaproteobacteria bacterium]|nr:hypothetical protein [Alphaproteobacteria bacterium]
MTVALCAKCGAKKFGSFTRCPECGFVPQTEDDFVYSLALSDHYFSTDTLGEIAASIKASGRAPLLPRDQEDKFREAIRQDEAILALLAKQRPVIECPKCGQKLRLPATGRGTVICPGCKAKIAAGASGPIGKVDEPAQEEGRARIEIMPPGTAVTDYAAATQLQNLAPKSFRKAQDVLVAASKYAKGSGWFSSERSRLQRFQSEAYELAKALDYDGYGRAGEKLPDKVFRFMNEFSRIFPNWQEEYKLLNRFFPQFW